MFKKYSYTHTLRLSALPGILAIIIFLASCSSGAPPDFSAIEDVNERKQAFFDYLQPYIEEINAQREAERESLLALQEKIAAGGSPNFLERRRLREWADRYGVEREDRNPQEVVDQLLIHLDQIPSSMVLAQAAMESAWGTSRFAVEGNNYFGQWCYEEGCGLVPSRRSAGASHEVRVFPTPEESIRSYFRNINGHAAYEELREIRAETRDEGDSLSGVELVGGLQRYSERGQDYIDELRSVIRFNDLE